MSLISNVDAEYAACSTDPVTEDDVIITPSSLTAAERRERKIQLLRNWAANHPPKNKSLLTAEERAERHRQKNREWYSANREKLAQKARERYYANHEANKLAARERTQTSRQKIAALQAELDALKKVAGGAAPKLTGGE